MTKRICAILIGLLLAFVCLGAQASEPECFKYTLAEDGGVYNVSGQLPEGAAYYWRTRFGLLQIDPNGVYRYQVDTALPEVQSAIAAGKALTDSFTGSYTDHNGWHTREITIALMPNGASRPAGVLVHKLTDLLMPIESRLTGTTDDTTTAALATYLGQAWLTDTGAYAYRLSNTHGSVQRLNRRSRHEELFMLRAVFPSGDVSDFALSVLITGANDAPRLKNIAAAITDGGAPIAGSVLDGGYALGDGRLEAHTFALSAGQSARFGTFTLAANGDYTYALASDHPDVHALRAGETLSETIAYSFTDPDGDSASAALTITINGANDTPTINNAGNSIAEDTETAITGNVVTGNHTLGDGTFAEHRFAWGEGQTADHGTFMPNADGTYSYALNNADASVQALSPGESLTETFPYSFTDKDGDSASGTLTITVNGTNDTPTIPNNAVEIAKNSATPITGSCVWAAYTLGDGALADHRIAWDANQTARYGTFAPNNNGAYTYTLNTDLDDVRALNAGQTLTEIFTYSITDKDGDTDTDTLTITINGVGSCAPVITNKNNDFHVAFNRSNSSFFVLFTLGDGTLAEHAIASVEVDVPDCITLTFNFYDNSNILVELTVDAAAAERALVESNILTTCYTYTITDKDGSRDTGTYILTLTPSLVPRIDNSANAVNANAADAITGDVKTGKIHIGTGDAEHHTFAWSANQQGTYGTFTPSTDGTYSYTINTANSDVSALLVGQKLTETFTYSVTDMDGDSANGTLTITINGMYTPPPPPPAIKPPKIIGNNGVTATESEWLADNSKVFSGTITVEEMPHIISSGLTDIYINTHNVKLASGTYGDIYFMSWEADEIIYYEYRLTRPVVPGSSGTITDSIPFTVSNTGGGVNGTITVTIINDPANDTP